MADDIIGMREMIAIFSVTDEYGVDREQISVPLGKEDPGVVRRLDTGEVEIVVPLTVPIEEWRDTLENGLKALGFVPIEEED
ncbi:MAG: hypothetical protein J4F46_03430 [Dehalococcoidia bacterium]|nr:hypothetical protein [Dehalococcoidia bacterium]